MIVVVERSDHQGIDVNKSFNIENEINNYRNKLKNQNILDVNNKEYDYQMGVYYMDIIAECEKYICTICEYVYDPELGDPENGIEPGTSFEDLPADWVCPLCGVGKDEFEKAS